MLLCALFITSSIVSAPKHIFAATKINTSLASPMVVLPPEGGGGDILNNWYVTETYVPTQSASSYWTGFFALAASSLAKSKGVPSFVSSQIRTATGALYSTMFTVQELILKNIC